MLLWGNGNSLIGHKLESNINLGRKRERESEREREKE